MVRKVPQNHRNDGLSTRNLILDTAEKLFSIDGYAAVSIRQITSKAGIDAALINYYFKSKENLFKEVLARRVEKMSADRIRRLSKIKIIKNDKNSIINLLNAFILPIVGVTKKEVSDLRNYRLLIALVANSKNWQEVIFKELYDPVAYIYIDKIKMVIPDASRSDICWGFSFFLGSLVNTLAETGRIDRLSFGECKSSDLDTAVEKLVEYSAAAFIEFGLKNK